MNARRFPRTLDEAYGPYHRSSQCPIEPMPDRMHPADRIVVKACALAFLALVVLITLEKFA